MKYPSKPEIGVGSVILENDKILLIKRINPPGKGKWSVPGGHLKLGESIYQAAVRELYEETNIKAHPLGIINIDEYIEIDKKNHIRYHYVLIDVLLKPRSDIRAAKPSTDVSELKMCTLKEALDLDLTKSTRSLILKLLKDKSTIINSNFIINRD